MTLKPVIVVVAYNRPLSLDRLLKSIQGATFEDLVTIIISLEGEAPESVKKIAYNFTHFNLQCKVIERSKRLGLRQHIIACGDMALEYGSVIILEDDLVVDKYFYNYALAALNYYNDMSLVAGIALYAPEYIEHANLPFHPMSNGYSTYPIQVPCSWGQCWTSYQWASFKSWYNLVESKLNLENFNLPKNVKLWPESSWKKYFSAYLVYKGLYFIYPYQAYSTNCTESGTHINKTSCRFQVKFANQNRLIPFFEFSTIIKPEIAYDAFMEPCGELVYRLIGIDKSEIEIDTLGLKSKKTVNKKYILTSNKMNEVIKKYPKTFRPIEHNFSYKLSHHEDEAFSLGITKNYINEIQKELSLDDYSYFLGIDMYSFKIIIAFIKALPEMVYKKIISSFKLL